ncbi:hypothetical protein ACMT1E_12545 [Sphingomonas flavalba]|uniref:hypothetical protein n=1 Tax=Sphingomonas flavalba TaxID=2559804 RepID=UPI0039E0F462
MKNQQGVPPDSGYATDPWRRYRRLMVWMVLVALIASVASLLGLNWAKGPLPIHMVIGTLLGVFGSVVLAAALMGLVFLSSGSGHDEYINEQLHHDE